MRYIFRSNKFFAPNLRIETTPPTCDVVTGYEVQPDGTRFPIHNFTCQRTYANRNIHDYQTSKSSFIRFFKKHSKLNGFIDFREGDTLYFHFWDIVSEDATTLNPNDVDSNDNGHNFKFLIPWNGNSFTIPFRYRTLTATNIPIQYNFGTQKVNTNFLNFNLAYLWAFGRTKFYRNTDINSRDVYFALGPFVGVTNIDNATQTVLSQFGYTFGGSFALGVYGLNFVSSFGVETGIQGHQSNFYTGIGIGYNLITVQSK